MSTMNYGESIFFSVSFSSERCREARLFGRSGKSFIAGSVSRTTWTASPPVLSVRVEAHRRRKKGFYGEEERCIACTDWRRCFNRRRSISLSPPRHIPSSDRKMDDRRNPGLI